jgi:thiamine transport system ATP-binding protein
MLRCVDLTVTFGATAALDRVTVDVGDNEIVAVMGPSGCGKTTLLRTIAGLQRPQHGTVRWNGTDLGSVPPHARGFGFMFQDYALFPHLDVAGNVEFGLRMLGQPEPIRRKRVDDLLALVGLAGYGDRAIHDLSGGEQQRVALARTLAPAPRLVLLDEPVGALDRALRDRLVGEMRRIFSEIGVAALYVTHDQDEAFSIADRVAVMARGRIVRAGTPEELWTNPGHEFVAGMLGLTAIVTATVASGYADIGWARLPTPLPDGFHRIAIPRRAVIVAAAGSLTGKVESATYRRGGYDVTIAIEAVTLTARMKERPAPGDLISFELDPDAVLPVESDVTR